MRKRAWFLKQFYLGVTLSKIILFERNAVVTVCGEWMEFSGRWACGNESLIRTLLGPGIKQKYLNKSTAGVLYRGREKILLLV